jgi:hypothetical protein
MSKTSRTKTQIQNFGRILIFEQDSYIVRLLAQTRHKLPQKLPQNRNLRNVLKNKVFASLVFAKA